MSELSGEKAERTRPESPWWPRTPRSVLRVFECVLCPGVTALATCYKQGNMNGQSTSTFTHNDRWRGSGSGSSGFGDQGVYVDAPDPVLHSYDSSQLLWVVHIQ